MSEGRVKNKLLFMSGLLGLVLLMPGVTNVFAQAPHALRGDVYGISYVKYVKQVAQPRAAAENPNYKLTYEKIWQAVQKGFHDPKFS